MVPRLSRSDFESLKRSIEKYGQYLPIVINSEGVILDGYHRYKDCIELGKEPHIARRRYENKIEEELFVIECNLKRRHLNSLDDVESQVYQIISKEFEAAMEEAFAPVDSESKEG